MVGTIPKTQPLNLSTFRKQIQIPVNRSQTQLGIRFPQTAVNGLSGWMLLCRMQVGKYRFTLPTVFYSSQIVTSF